MLAIFVSLLAVISFGSSGPVVDCVVTDWVDSGSCSVTCGGGVREQTRSVLTHAANGGNCCGVTTQTISCNDEPCPPPPSECSWNDLSEVSLDAPRYSANYDISNVLDPSARTFWFNKNVAHGTPLPTWITFTFTYETKISGFRAKPRTANPVEWLKKYEFQYSNDGGSTWIKHVERDVALPNHADWDVHEFASTPTSRFFRLYISESYDPHYVAIVQMNLKECSAAAPVPTLVLDGSYCYSSGTPNGVPHSGYMLLGSENEESLESCAALVQAEDSSAIYFVYEAKYENCFLHSDAEKRRTICAEDSELMGSHPNFDTYRFEQPGRRMLESQPTVNEQALQARLLKL